MLKLKTLSICIVLINIFLPLSAQTNFVDGRIINNKGDTLKGQIDYQEWVYNPKKIRFRTDNFSDGTYYTAKDIKGFTIGYKDERYESAIVDVNYEPTDIEKLEAYESIDSVDPNIKLTRDTVFLLTLAKGRLNFFELQQYEHDNLHFFVQNDSRPPQELILRMVKIKRRDSLFILTIDTYKNQLKNLTSDCFDVKQNFIRLLYQRNELLPIIKKYNACAKASYYVKKQEKGDRFLSVWAGTMRPVTDLDDLNELDIFSPKETMSNKISPLIAVSYEQNYNRLRNKLGIGGELIISQVNIQHRKTITYSLGDRHFDYLMNSFAVSLNSYIRYYFTTKKLQPYIKGGLGLTYYSNTKLTRVKSEEFTNPVETTLSVKKTQPNFLLGLGLKYSNFILEPRFEGWAKSSTTSSDPILIKRVSLFAGYSWNLSKKVLKNR